MVLTQVVLLHVADVAVDGRVAEDDQHDGLAALQQDAVRRVALHGVDLGLGGRPHRRVPALPRPAGDVEHPQLVRHVAPAGLQFTPEHEDVVLGRRGERFVLQ